MPRRRRSEEECEYARELGQRIRGARLTRGVSALELERRGVVHRNLMRSYEKGESIPTAFNLLRIARALDVSPVRLLRGPKTVDREPMICSPGVTVGTEMLHPELRNGRAQ